MLATDGTYYFRWKPAGLPSSFGEEDSFVDAIVSGDEKILSFYPKLPSLVSEQLDTLGYQPLDIEQVRQTLLHTFDSSQERGLLNRLDTPTQGRLYFAPTIELYQHYKLLQQQEKVQKYYVTEVVGDCSWLFRKTYTHVSIHDEVFHIGTPIMHHQHLEDRMVPVLHEASMSKGRGALHHPQTRCRIIGQTKDTTWLLVSITKGVRHQIRVHLSSLGYPVVGDVLYGNSETTHLHLWSIGMHI